MKTHTALLSVLILVCSIGCSPQHVETLKGKGTVKTFDASYDRTWSAAVSALETLELTIDSGEKTSGYIAAHMDKRATSWGEEVGVWIARVDDTRTSVEVVSRRVGPSGFFKYDWEEPILYQVRVSLMK